jgi:hypothetical protein
MTTISGPSNPVVSDDGSELLVLGAADGGFQVHRVNVATGKSTTVTTFRTEDRSGLEPSGLAPDGRSMLYHTALPPFTLLYDIDLSTLLRGR